jgi:hypothetical protein
VENQKRLWNLLFLIRKKSYGNPALTRYPATPRRIA